MTDSTSGAIAFSDRELKNWREFERVRKSGRWNMFAPEARAAAKLSSPDYNFAMKNYSALKAAAAKSGVA